MSNVTNDHGQGRINWIDCAKGLGIILVVYGHVIRGLIDSGILRSSATIQFLDSWIYAFHMPLFFFLSGLFLPRSTKTPWGIFAFGKIRTIAYPYFLWSAITLGLKDILGALPNRPASARDLPLILYHPIEQYWFLYVLFVLTLIISALLRFGMSRWIVLGLALLVFPGVIPTAYWGFVPMEARAYAIYMAIGVVIAWHLNLSAIAVLPALWLTLTVLLGLIVSSLAGLFHADTIQISTLPFGVTGITAVVALSVLLGRHSHAAALQFLGRYSLEIYVAHTIASAGTRIALQHFAHVLSPAPQIVLGILAGLYLPVMAAVVAERVGFRFGFTIPSTA